jgi:acetyl esterase/lipase
MGDSAGGNFALILAQQIKIKKLKRPKNIILFSPLLSFYVGEEDSKKIKEDPVLPFHLLKEVNIMQLGKNNPKNPLFSPFFGDNKNIGNIYIYCGQNEVFASAIKDYCNKLDQDKVTYTLNIKKNMFHDYPIFVLTKEALETNKLIYKIFKK